MLIDLARRFLYSSGLLPLYHRLRNAGSLTVVTFHRTLSEDDPRWPTCDPDYTMPRDVFAHSLAFFRRHYNVVSLAQVHEAQHGGTPLPPRALLVTFDDGWRDNADHALPELRHAKLPAAMFVAASAVGQGQPFWQEQLIVAWRRGALTLAQVEEAVDAKGGERADGAQGSPETMDRMRHTIERIEALPPDVRMDLIAAFAPDLDDGLQHMVEPADLDRLQAGGVSLGLHGKRHIRIPEADDVDAELLGAREALVDAMANDGFNAAGGLRSMSFPHGAYDARVAQRARDSGYDLLFTSVPVLNPVHPRPGWLLGRTGFEASGVLDARRRFRPDWLAWYLFRRPARRLEA